jgi:hypothetical protein
MNLHCCLPHSIQGSSPRATASRKYDVLMRGVDSVWEAAAEAQAKAREEVIQRQAVDAESANRMREEMRAQALGNKGVWR